MENSRHIVLRAEGIGKTYAKGTSLETQALKPSNLEIEEGVFYAVIGRSGSGKSTLLHSAASTVRRRASSLSKTRTFLSSRIRSWQSFGAGA